MKTILVLAVLLLGFFIMRRGSFELFQSEKDAYFSVEDVLRFKRFVSTVGKDEKNVGKYNVDGRYVNIKEDSIYVTLTLIDLKGPNRPFKLPPIPATFDSLKVFYELETVDIKYADDSVFIIGFAKGKQVIKVGIRKSRPDPRPGDVTTNIHTPRAHTRGFYLNYF